MKNLIFVSIGLFIFLCSSVVALACGCPTVGPYGPVESSLKYGAAVFSGEVLEIRSYQGHRKVTFKVIEFWKGDVTTKYTVATDTGRTSCRYNFEIRKNYLIFSGFSEYGPYTAACSGNRELEKAEAELKILGKGKTPTSPCVKK